MAYRQTKRKNNSAMSVVALLIMLAIAVVIIILTAVLMGGDETSIPSVSLPSQSQDGDETSAGADTSEPPTSTSTPDTSEPDTSEPEYTYTYVTDVSDYMWAIEPEDRDGFLILLNPDNTLPASYVPEDLVDVRFTRDDGRATQMMVREAEAALFAFLTEAAACGYGDVSVTSAYRSYTYQSQLFENKVSQYIDRYPTREEAEEKAATIVARPGTSEHQTGLAADMHNMASAEQSFGETEAAKWLAANAYKFGFILRYEEDKQDITKIIYEPWHFRYVGRYHATRIYESGMCFEEYLESINK